MGRGLFFASYDTGIAICFRKRFSCGKNNDFLLEVLPFLPCNCRIEGQKHAYMQAEPTSAVPNKTPVAILSCILLRRLLASTQAKKASDWYVETLRSVWSEGEFWNNQTSVSGANAKRCAHAAASCDLFVKQRLPIHGDRLCHQSASEAGSPRITGIHWIHLSMLPCIDNLDRGFGCTSLRQQILLSAGVMAAKGTVNFSAARRMALQQIKNLKPF